MSTRLIFDIETIGVDFDSLDERTKEYLLSPAKTPEEVEFIKNGLGLSPLTGEIVAIGIYNPDTKKGAVYYRADKDEKSSNDHFQFIPCGDEKSLLKEFWETATHYDQFISFGGHNFDCPYLMTRSAANKVKPTRNLLQNRYHSGIHLDVLDRLTNYGYMGWRKRGTLEVWCKVFGIKSPKSDDASGLAVQDLFKNKKYLDIAKYCGGDVKATAELYQYWDKYINVK